MAVTVFGTYLNPDGTPAEGAVRFTLVPPSVADQSGEQYTEGPVVCTLDDNGSFRAQLVPDPVLIVNGWAGYIVNERVVGLMRTWKLVLDGQLDTINVPAFYPGPQVELGAVKPVPGGPAGMQGEVEVESTRTLPAGEPATVEDLDPSAHRALLRFGIPQGAQGERGPAGADGITVQGALDDLTDVDTTGITNGQTIIYDQATQTYRPGTAVGGGGDGVDEVWVGPGTPPAMQEIWIDTDAVDPPTDGGGGGTATRFVHTQSTPAQVWTVQHELGCHPAVTVEDGGGTFIHGTVDYVDDSTLTVGFAFALTGRVNCV